MLEICCTSTNLEAATGTDLNGDGIIGQRLGFVSPYMCPIERMTEMDLNGEGISSLFYSLRTNFSHTSCHGCPHLEMH